MRERGKQDTGPTYQNSAYYPGQPKGPVFPGKPYRDGPANMAVQKGMMELFDEFTQVISGELKSMNLEEFEAERRNSQGPG